jgi:hypothetical protein
MLKALLVMDLLNFINSLLMNFLPIMMRTGLDVMIHVFPPPAMLFVWRQFNLLVR